MKHTVPKLPTPPPVRLRWGLEALRWYFAPEYLHLERADKRRPTLFVGNHSLRAGIDVEESTSTDLSNYSGGTYYRYWLSGPNRFPQLPAGTGPGSQNLEVEPSGGRCEPGNAAPWT